MAIVTTCRGTRGRCTCKVRKGQQETLRLRPAKDGRQRAHAARQGDIQGEPASLAGHQWPLRAQGMCWKIVDGYKGQVSAEKLRQACRRRGSFIIDTNKVTATPWKSSGGMNITESKHFRVWLRLVSWRGCAKRPDSHLEKRHGIWRIENDALSCR